MQLTQEAYCIGLSLESLFVSSQVKDIIDFCSCEQFYVSLVGVVKLVW